MRVGDPVGVLVVRSRPSLERLVRHSLRGRHCMIRTTTSFRSKLHGVRSCSCSYILLSVVLPSNGKLGLLRRLGGVHGQRGMVVVSTGSSLSSGMLKLRLNTSSCLPGPFRLTRLGTHVGDIVQHRHHSKRVSVHLTGVHVIPSAFRMFMSSGRVRLGHGRCSVLLCFTGHPKQLMGGGALTRSI